MDSFPDDGICGEVVVMGSKREQMDKGSITAEAAFVVPLVLMVVFLSVLLAFYVHNRAWYTAAAAESVLTASSVGVRKHAGTEKILNEKMEERMKKQGFPIRSLSFRTTARNDSVTAEVKAAAGKTYGGGGWKFHAQEMARIIKPVVFIRRIQGISAFVEEER